jgi:hypothetical protein
MSPNPTRPVAERHPAIHVFDVASKEVDARIKSGQGEVSLRDVTA